MIRRTPFLLFLITASLYISSTAHAYYFIEPLGHGNWFLQSGLAISKGPSESLSFYTQYGFTKWLDVKIKIPGIIYHDDAIGGRFFSTNPYVGFLAEVARDEKNSFSIMQNYTLPFREARGLDLITRFVYRREINSVLKYFTMFIVPFNKYTNAAASYSISVVPVGIEYFKGKFYNQTYIEIGEKIRPYREFEAGFSSYNSYIVDPVSPAIEICYFPSPKTGIWTITVGITKIINML